VRPQPPTLHLALRRSHSACLGTVGAKTLGRTEVVSRTFFFEKFKLQILCCTLSIIISHNYLSIQNCRAALLLLNESKIIRFEALSQKLSQI